MFASIEDRRALMYALAEAAELEHSICLQYLYAAFSLKKHQAEGDLGPRQLQFVRDAATTLLLVARQEMEHLNLVINLQLAIGGAPHFRRPNFPKPADYYGELGAFELTPFSERSLKRFIDFEKPEPFHLFESIRAGVDALARKSLKSNIASKKRHEEFEAALSVVLQKICNNVHWNYGEAWIPDSEHKALICSSAWFAVHPEDERIEAFRKKTLDLSSSGTMEAGIESEVLADPRFAPSSLAVNKGTAPGRVEEATAAGLNACAAVPIVVDGHVLAVLSFFFETYQSVDEGDQSVQLVREVVNATDEEAGKSTLGALLLKEGENLPLNLIDLVSSTATSFERLTPQAPKFSSIGAFYRLIRKGFHDVVSRIGEDRLFVVPAALQVSNEEIGLIQPGWRNIDVFPVTDIGTAVKAINQIIEEGEGAPSASDDSHYARFFALSERFKALRKADPSFEPARRVVSNPSTFFPLGMSENDRDRLKETHTLIDHPFTVRVVDLFNAAYELLLFLMMSFYRRSDATQAELNELSQFIFSPMMSQIIRPLGEIITLLPANESDPSLMAGASFAFFRDTDPLPHVQPGFIFFAERLKEMAAECAQLVEQPIAPDRLKTVSENLSFLSVSMDRIAFPQTP